MKIHKLHLVAVLLGSLLLPASCVDDKYDLDDIDTTTGIKLDNLVVPVNLRTIKLDQVLDINDQSVLVKFPENASPEEQYYAIRQCGEFNADEVYVETLNAVSNATVKVMTLAIDGVKVPPQYTHYSYLVKDVDKSLEALYYLGMEASPMRIDLFVKSEGNNVNLENVTVKLPEKFVALYKNTLVADGLVNVGNLVNGEMEEPIYVVALNFGEEGMKPVDDTLDIDGDDLGIESATLSAPTTSEVTAEFSLSPFTADFASALINYQVEAPEIQPVSLDGLPDFLKEGDTNLILTNPQIYLNFANPLGVPFTSSLEIEPFGNGGNVINDELIPFENSIVLAVDRKDLPLANELKTETIQEIPSLSYILAGDGLPESIRFNIYDTYLRGIASVQLGQYMSVAGSYTFFSPLAFSQGADGESTRIIYHKAEKDFFGDDVKDVDVSKLVITADPKSDLPFDVEVTLYPLDKNGDRIQDASHNTVKASGFVKAYANGSEPLRLELNQPFKGLDGVEYIVKVDNMNGEHLSPAQSITLNNIRATLSGQYITDF